MKRKTSKPKDTLTDDISQRRLLNLEEKLEKLRDQDLKTTIERLGGVESRLTKLEEGMIALEGAVTSIATSTTKLEGTVASLAKSTSTLVDFVKGVQSGQQTLAIQVAGIATAVALIHEAVKKPEA